MIYYQKYKLSTVLIWLIFLSTLLESCESLIEVEQPANQISRIQVFESTQTADAALDGLYGALWDNSPLSGAETGRLLSVYTDELDFFAITSNTGLFEIFENKQISGNVAILSYWTTAYQLVYSANAILEGVENSVKIKTIDKNRIIGEALYIRSVLFLYLQQIFGDIPLVFSTDYLINQRLGKTPEVETLSLLEADLQRVIELLADDYRQAERIFINRKVAELTLAKVFMLQGKWGYAEQKLKMITTSTLYSFQPDVTKVFEKTGQHVLWQLQPRNPGDITKESQNYYFANTAPTGTALSHSLIDIFAEEDLRKLHWMAAVTVGSNTWYRPDKYKNRVNNNSEYSIVFRLEEVYLSLAEALAQQGKVEEALFYLNAIRQRSALAVLEEPLTQASLLDSILEENHREFFTEMGHRFFDLKRMGRLDDLFMVKPNWKAYHSLWPLPEKELLLNPNLNPQNIGY